MDLKAETSTDKLIPPQKREEVFGVINEKMHIARLNKEKYVVLPAYFNFRNCSSNEESTEAIVNTLRDFYYRCGTVQVVIDNYVSEPRWCMFLRYQKEFNLLP